MTSTTKVGLLDCTHPQRYVFVPVCKICVFVWGTTFSWTELRQKSIISAAYLQDQALFVLYDDQSAEPNSNINVLWCVVGLVDTPLLLPR